MDTYTVQRWAGGGTRAVEGDIHVACCDCGHVFDGGAGEGVVGVLAGDDGVGEWVRVFGVVLSLAGMRRAKTRDGEIRAEESGFEGRRQGLGDI